MNNTRLSSVDLDIDLDRDLKSAADRVALWRDALRLSGKVEVDDADTFWGRFSSRSFGVVRTMSIASAPFHFTRDRAMCRRVVKDYVIVNLIEDGCIKGSLAGRKICAEAGSIIVSRFANVMDVQLIDAKWHSLLVPRSLVDQHVPWTASRDGRVFTAQRTETAVLGGLLRSLIALPDPVGVNDAAIAVRASLALLAACFAGPGRAPTVAEEDIGADQIRHFIEQRLRDPELNIALICRELSLSRSALYRLMGNQADIMATIRRMRLRRFRRDLVSPQFSALSLAAIGRLWGLENERSLRRAFVAEFGSSPSEVRKNAQRAGKKGEAFEAQASAELENWLLG